MTELRKTSIAQFYQAQSKEVIQKFNTFIAISKEVELTMKFKNKTELHISTSKTSIAWVQKIKI